jgi:hypothetical protein
MSVIFFRTAMEFHILLMLYFLTDSVYRYFWIWDAVDYIFVAKLTYCSYLSHVRSVGIRIEIQGHGFVEYNQSHCI